MSQQNPLQAYEQWLKLSASPRTAYAYLYTIRKFIERFGKDPSQAKPEEIYAFLSNFSPRSAHRHAYALRSYLMFLGRFDLAGKVPKPKFTTSLPNCITNELVRKMLLACDNLREKCIIACMYELALRRGEVVLLNRDDFDYNNRLMRVHRLKTKGGLPEDHILPISDELAEMIQMYLNSRNDNERALFVCGDPPRRISSEMVRYIFKKIAKRIGMPDLKPHVLRHTRLTELAKMGLDLIDLAKFAHHKSPSSTLIYIHLAHKDIVEKLKRT